MSSPQGCCEHCMQKLRGHEGMEVCGPAARGQEEARAWLASRCWRLDSGVRFPSASCGLGMCVGGSRDIRRQPQGSHLVGT